MSKDRTINLEPYEMDWSVHNDQFHLIFHGRSQDNKTKIIIKLHFEFWWIAYIARKLWKIIAIQKRELNSNIYHMKGDNNENSS